MGNVEKQQESAFRTLEINQPQRMRAQLIFTLQKRVTPGDAGVTNRFKTNL